MEERLLEIVRRLEGPRDGVFHHEALSSAADYITGQFRAMGFVVVEDLFEFNGRYYRNLVATADGINTAGEWLAVGSHYDAVAGSPGADDNASGVAVMLETARALGPREGLQFIAFSLEEPQATGASFLYGSRHFVRRMKREGHRYRCLFNLESVGYIDSRPGSQAVPPLVRAPSTGDFIAIVGNGAAVGFMEEFTKAARLHAPDLKVFSHKAAMRGYLLPSTRLSDHAPFWDAGFPAVMVTDTAMLRNPHYHTPGDRSETLSLPFMASIARTLSATMEVLLGEQVSRQLTCWGCV